LPERLLQQPPRLHGRPSGLDLPLRHRRQRSRQHWTQSVFIFEPGYTLTLEDGKDRRVITVLNDTRRVDGIETRVVEERETSGNALTEVSRNYFAISTRTNAAFYFCEDGHVQERHDRQS
jgi:hypothetical protein